MRFVIAEMPLAFHAMMRCQPSLQNPSAVYPGYTSNPTMNHEKPETRARTLGIIACGLLLLALTGAGLYEQRRDDISAFVTVALVQGAVYLAAATLVWRGRGSRRAVGLILGIAAAMRLLVLFAP